MRKIETGFRLQVTGFRGKAFGFKGFFVPQNFGDEAGDGVDNRHGWQFAAR